MCFFQRPLGLFLLGALTYGCARGAGIGEDDAGILIGGDGPTTSDAMPSTATDASASSDDASVGDDGAGDDGSNGGGCNATGGTCGAPWDLTWGAAQGDGSYVATFASSTFRQCSQLAPASCEGAGAMVAAREGVHRIEMPIDGTLSISVQAGGVDLDLGQPWPASVYLLSSCEDASSAVACTGAAAGTAPVALAPTDTFTMGQTLFLYVDGAEANALGAYKLTVIAKP